MSRLRALAILLFAVFCSSSHGADLALPSKVIQPCKQVHSPPDALMVWYLTPSLGYYEENGDWQIQGATYSVKKESETWGFGDDMVYTLIARYDPYDDYILSVKGKEGGSNTDGFYYVSIERTYHSVIRRMYISHFEECSFKSEHPTEMQDIYAVSINQYDPVEAAKKAEQAKKNQGSPSGKATTA